jgi:hypothetical protein
LEEAKEAPVHIEGLEWVACVGEAAGAVGVLLALVSIIVPGSETVAEVVVVNKLLLTAELHCLVLDLDTQNILLSSKLWHPLVSFHGHWKQ